MFKIVWNLVCLLTTVYCIGVDVETHNPLGSVQFPDDPDPVDSYINCQRCQGGPLTHCGQVIGRGVEEGFVCKTNLCYEAYIGYQNGAMPIVQRRCWQPNENETAPDYCTWFETSEQKKKTNAIMIACKHCTEDLCNLDKEFWLDPRYIKYPNYDHDKHHHINHYHTNYDHERYDDINYYHTKYDHDRHDDYNHYLTHYDNVKHDYHRFPYYTHQEYNRY
uniref:Uncharacterized protein LOC114337817 n=1 Tax=Diabrotica virgifera virgifera TaxID=50390 RepID=A0A6P7GGF6_DIAVI